MDVSESRVSILNSIFGQCDGAANRDRVARHRRTLVDYECTDRLGTFRRRVQLRGEKCRVSALGNRFARLVELSVAQVTSEERQRQAARTIHTYDEFVDCLFDRGVTVARATLNPVHGGNVDGNRRMEIVRNAINAVWLLLDAQEWRLEPFQWRYLQCFLLGMFKRLIGSDTNRYVHEVLRLLDLATPEMATYDPKFPDASVAEEMTRIFEAMSRKMWVIVAPRRSGKSVTVRFAIALAMAFADKDMNILLMANTLDTARLHLEPVHELLKTMERLGLIQDVRISKNDRDVTIVFVREKRKSIFHIIAGAPHVSIVLLFIIYLCYLSVRVIRIEAENACAMAANIQGIQGGPGQQQQQQQPQRFGFDLDTENANPYVKNFVFTFTKTNGWNVLPLRDHTLSPTSILLVEGVEVWSVQACGQPYVLLHDDGRFVGRTTTILEEDAIPSPPSFPKWAVWNMHVHGVCGLDGIERSATKRPVEALNEERFFLSELYMTLPQLVRAHEDDGGQYRLRVWQTQINAHIPQSILRNIRHGSVSQCLKQRYLQCPLLRPRPDHPFANLHIYIGADKKNDTDEMVRVVVRVTGKRICNVCAPSNNPPTFETFSETIIQSVDSGIDFADFFRRCPIRFHRDRFALR